MCTAVTHNAETGSLAFRFWRNICVVSADFVAPYCTNGASCKAAILFLIEHSDLIRTAKYIHDIYIIDEDMESQT